MNMTSVLKKGFFQSGQLLVLIGFISIVAFAQNAVAENGSANEGGEEAGHDDKAEEVRKGPHRGRLLAKGNFEVELAIFEKGVPPEYRAWATVGGKIIAPADWSLSVTLTRLGGKVDDFPFSVHEDYLLGAGVVEEPHSFDVAVEALYQGQKYTWRFPSHEGRLQIATEVAQKTGVRSDIARAGRIQQVTHLYGRLVANPQNISQVTARFPGLIRKINVSVGDKVKAGQVVAEVEANESLKRYPLRAPISGTVTQRFVNPGELAAEGPLMTIVNHQQVWLELNLFPADVQRVKVGQAVAVKLGNTLVAGKIDHVNLGSGSALEATARVVLDNKKQRWPLGLMVGADVVVGVVNAPLVVANTALQNFRDWTVAFIQVGNTYEIRPLNLGRTDGKVTEVLEGLNPGDRYVVENSYLLKADLEKSGASHDH